MKDRQRLVEFGGTMHNNMSGMGLGRSKMAANETIELPIRGMDCAECAQHVQEALVTAPGVKSAAVYLLTERAVLQIDRDQLDMALVEKAVADAGYTVGRGEPPAVDLSPQLNIGRQVGRLTAGLSAAVILVVVFGELLGLFEFLTELIPLGVGVVIVFIAGYPVFKKVGSASYRLKITSHTLMTMGVLAALIVGQWVTALVVVFFMRIGDYVEHFTSDQARQAIRQLETLAPVTARIVRNGQPVEISIEELKVDDVVEIRPGDRIPVDGEVVDGQATIDQSTITGESMPVDVGVGAHVYAATLARLGSIRVKTDRVGTNTTFGQIITMVEESESQRSDIQSYANKFSTYYLPIVAAFAGLTYVLTGDALATAAVLVVACSCSIALATPIAMLASIGAAAKSGLLIKGGKYLESLERADVLLIDKTGTLTMGCPKVADVRSLDDLDPSQLLIMAASAERYSEHPLAEAVRQEAVSRNLSLLEPTRFSSIPGEGIEAIVDGKSIKVGNRNFVTEMEVTFDLDLDYSGQTLVYIGIEDKLAGVLALTDTIRPEVPESIKEIKELGITRIELLTGDNRKVASSLAAELGIAFQAELLPEDKISIVKEYQAQGLTVVMVGDGVNDAPALAQADVGIAMGAAGSNIALEAADTALMQDNWRLVPELFRISQRTMRVVKMNLGLTGVYNVIGLSLAAAGLLPPVFAAAAQSIPDLGILANSSRLLRQ
jgi:Cd2+/Zn2+-exporting ATPase/Cu+-exporting ATPase